MILNVYAPNKQGFKIKHKDKTDHEVDKFIMIAEDFNTPHIAIDQTKWHKISKDIEILKNINQLNPISM